MLSAQARGHTLLHYDVDSLTLEARRLTGVVRARSRVRNVGATISPPASRSASTSATFDVVLMRQDPPFHMGYITAAHLLELVDRRDAGGERSAGACVPRRKRS